MDTNKRIQNSNHFGISCRYTYKRHGQMLVPKTNLELGHFTLICRRNRQIHVANNARYKCKAHKSIEFFPLTNCFLEFLLSVCDINVVIIQQCLVKKKLVAPAAVPLQCYEKSCCTCCSLQGCNVILTHLLL